jgi:ferritin-like metal-binding protein YciE
MNLKDLFLDELADIHFAENHIAKALPKMAKAATDEDLKEAILSHLEETKGHIEKVKQVFATFDEKPKSKECKATLGLLAEGDEIAADNKGEPTINAAIISACQKVEHYEIASYGSLSAWAQLLGNDEAVNLLEEILGEEKAADEKLTGLAEDKNQEALEDEGADGEEAEARKPAAGQNKKK